MNTIEISHYPDRPESYRLTHRIGAALVRYDGAKYGPLLDTAAIVQQRRLGFEVTVMTRDLGWSFGGEVGHEPGRLRHESRRSVRRSPVFGYQAALKCFR